MIYRNVCKWTCFLESSAIFCCQFYSFRLYFIHRFYNILTLVHYISNSYVCGAVVLILMAAGLILFKIQEKKAAEAETLKYILNTPVGLSPEKEELKQKYKE